MPEVWSTLRADVLPAYQAALAHPRASSYEDALRGFVPLHRRVKGYSPPEIQALSTLLKGWQEEWRFTPEWCEQYALRGLHLWNALPEHQGLTPLGSGWGGYVPELEPLTLPPWDPFHPWSDYEARATKRLAEYREASLATLVAAGWEPLEIGRPDVVDRHLAWLALRITGSRVTEIAARESDEGHHPDLSTVQKAISKMARRVGFDGMANV